MSIRTQIDHVRGLILDGKLNEADSLLATLQSLDRVEQRMLFHTRAFLLFNRGQYLQAKALIDQAVEKFGENVRLIRDRAVCQFNLQDMMGFRATMAYLENLLVQLEPTLEIQTLVECEIVMGKFLEEEARLAPAQSYFSRALNRAHKMPLRLRALIQLARWHALYEPSQELSNYYRELISVGPQYLSQDLNIELQHSLMLMEIRLIGSDHAWQRVERLPATTSNYDRRLFLFDYIEGALSLDLELDEQILKMANEFDDLDPFESFLKHFIHSPFEPVALIRELTLLATQLPWASYLRLLCIAANSDKQSSVRQELHRKIQLIVHALDPRSQELWSQRLKETLQTPEIRIDFSARQRSIVVQGKAVDLSKKKMGLLLLEALVATSTLSVDEAIQLIWQSSFSPEHYHRLRMGIHRLNTLIHECTGLGKIIEVDSQTVRLRPEVRLRHAEGAFDSQLIGL